MSLAGDCASPISVTTLRSTRTEAICLMFHPTPDAPLPSASTSPVYTACWLVAANQHGVPSLWEETSPILSDQPLTRMPFETIFLDAGGTLVWPNLERVSETLRAYGIQVDAAALAASDPLVRRSLDEPHLIAAATDHRRGWNYFESVLVRAGVALTPAAQRALSRLEEYQRTTNLWESVPAFVAPALEELRRRGYKLVVVSNANGTVRRAFQRIGLFELVDIIVDSFPIQRRWELTA